MDKKLEYIYNLYPNAKCELNYSSLFELLVAVVLSAQTTDAKVNKVTPILFKQFSNALALSKADKKIISQILKPIGMNNIKAKNIISLSKKLVDDFEGIVPNNQNDLVSLPGVGRKTANVVLAEGYKLNYFAVDTHIMRVAKRLRYAKESDNSLQIEEKMCQVIPNDYLKDMHIRMIFFGRYQCMAKKPNCSMCKLKGECTFTLK